MTPDLKPYPAMKDSGMPWLGEVPERWSLLPNKVMLRRRKTLVGERHTDYQLLSLTKMGVIVRDVSTSRGKFSADMGTFQEVRCGDLVFCLFDVPETPRTIGLSCHKGMITGAYDVFECDDHVLARYLEAFYIAMDDRKLLSPLYLGLRNTIPIPKFLGAKTPVPPLLEQAAIVRFLDHADRRIRRYIRAKQKLIVLLEEQKQALIHRAVTRGLDPNVRLKPSGVEWLGAVPEHWEVRRVKSLSLVKRGASPRPIADQNYFDGYGEYAWVRIADVTASSRYLERTTQRLSVLGQSLSVPLEPGALFLSIAGSVGKPIITRIKCCIHDGFVYFPQFTGDVEFLCRIFASGAPFARLGKLGTQLNLNTDTVGSISLGWPPSEEQAAIVSFLDRSTAALDAATTSARREISLLGEYHTRLIGDVVTGKLDVREAAARLPDEVEEMEAVDGADALINGEQEPTDALATAPEEAAV